MKHFGDSNFNTLRSGSCPGRDRQLSSVQKYVAESQLAFSSKVFDRNDIQRCNQELDEAITADNVLPLLDEFDAEMKIVKNYAFWSSYVQMVDIFLSFIKAQITGNWTLHVVAFTAMLPWLNVYDHTKYARWGPVYLMDMVLLEKSDPEVYKEFVAGNVETEQTCV